NGK
ncbi:hypothetical protein ECFRIK1999_1378, partial [Escherichia coli FRIK1999]